jgi:zinc protease
MVKDNNIAEGTEALLREAERVKQYGFTTSELERNEKGFLRSIEKAYTERNKTESYRLISDYIQNYLTQEPAPGIAYEYNLLNKIIPEITLDEVNAIVPSLLKINNSVIIIDLPQKENIEAPDTSKLTKIFSAVRNEKLTPYVDKVSDSELLSVKLNPVKILSEKKIKEIGVTELKLPNGATVVLKPTDFKNDEIFLSAFGPGGNSLATDSNFISASFSQTIINGSGIGKLDEVELQKLLTGKVVRVLPWISELSEGFSASASPEDLKMMFELIYLNAVSPRKDSSSFLSLISRLKTILENRSANPRFAFQDTIQATMNQYHFRYRPWTVSVIPKINLDSAFNFYKERFRNAGRFTYIIVGSFDIEKIKPYIQTYIGNLPSSGNKETWKDVGRSYPKGVIEKQVFKGIEPKSQVSINFTGPFKWTDQNVFNIVALTDVLEIKLREVLREDKGGTYGVSISASPSRYPKEEYEINISFGCDPQKTNELVDAALTQIDSLKKFGIDFGHVAKVKEIDIRSREVNLKRNDLWLNQLYNAYYYGEDPRSIFNYDKFVKELSPKTIQDAAIEYFNMHNYVKVILYPESTSN